MESQETTGNFRSIDKWHVPVESIGVYLIEDIRSCIFVHYTTRENYIKVTIFVSV